MRKRFLLTVSSFLCAIMISVIMFMVKYEVVREEDELSRINEKIIKAQRDIHILNAELAHLTEPRRIRELARKYNNMEDVKPYQIIKLEDLPSHKENSIRKASYNGGRR